MSDFTSELAKLHQLSGAEFSRQVERIALRKEFHPLTTDENILSVGGENSDDYQNLLMAARKAVEFGYKVYILPNGVWPQKLISFLRSKDYMKNKTTLGRMVLKWSRVRDVLLLRRCH